MKNQDDQPEETAPSSSSRPALRRRAEDAAREKAGRLPENLEALSLEELRQVFHELRVHQIELEMQKEELRQAMVEREAIKARYFDLYDLAPVGYLTLNERGLILEANLTAATLLGVDRGALIEQPITRFILPEDQDIYYLHCQQLFETGEPQGFALRMLGAKVTPFWSQLEAVLVQDSDGVPECRVVMSNINERKRTEEKLQCQSQILNQVHDAVVTTDLKGIITGWNAGAERMFAYSAEEALGKPVSFIYPEDQHRFLTEGIVVPLRQKGHHITEVRVRSKSGKEFPIHLSLSLLKDGKGEVVGMVGSSIDITERQRAEEALRESEERLKEAQRVGRLGSWDLNIVTGDLQWSDECYRIYGLRPQEFVPTYEKFRSIVYPEDLGFVQEQVDAALNNDKHYDVDFRFVRPNGEIGWIHCYGEILRDAEGKPLRFFGTQIDITERKQAEEALQESEERLRSLSENLAEGMVYQINSSPDGQQRKFSYLSPAVERLHGLHGQDVKRNPVLLYDQIEGKHRVKLEAAEARAYATRSKLDIDVQIRLPSGAVRWRRFLSSPRTHSDGSIIWDGIELDVTEHKQAKENTLLANERLHYLLSSTTAVIYVAKISGDYGTTYISPSVYRLTGYQPDEFMAASNFWYDRVHPEDQSRIETAVSKVFEHEYWGYEYRFQKKDGAYIWVQDEMRLVCDEENNPLEIIGFWTDITACKQAEQRMQWFSQEIITVREEEKKQVSSVLHNEVGSLAVGLSAYLDAIEADLHSGKPKAALQWVKRTRTLFDQQVALLKEVIVQLRPPELDVLGLGATLRQYFSQLTRHKFIRVQYRESLGPWRVSGATATVLFRVVQETLTNAVKHGQAKQVKVGLRASEGEVSLTVGDNGKGFDPSALRVPTRSQLGLRVMQEMATSLGGVFTIDSERGKGTTVQMRLPLATTALAVGDLTVRAETVAPGKTNRSSGRGSRPQKRSEA